MHRIYLHVVKQSIMFMHHVLRSVLNLPNDLIKQLRDQWPLEMFRNCSVPLLMRWVIIEREQRKAKIEDRTPDGENGSALRWVKALFKWLLNQIAPPVSDKAFPLNFPSRCTSVEQHLLFKRLWFMLHNYEKCSYQLQLNYGTIFNSSPSHIVNTNR